MNSLAILGAISAMALTSVYAHEHDEAALTAAQMEVEKNTFRLVEVAPGVEKWANGLELMDLSAKAHRQGRCGGYIDVTNFPKSDFTFRGLIDFDRIELKQQNSLNAMIAKVNTASLMARVSHLASYKNRYFQSETGVQAANWIADQYRAMSAGRADIEVTLQKHSFAQPSVIATIRGTGPQKDEVVIVGGHIDSINQSAIFNPRGAAAPGADDNASGTATVMEAFRIFVESGLRPNRTIQFMGYAGEEKGLLGSADIAQLYRKDGRVVVGVLQLDMTMYPGPNPALVFMTDYTDDGLTRFTQRLVDAYVKAKWNTDKCGYGCSDHASWDRAGYPAVMPFESTFNGMNPKIHSPSDTIALLDPNHGTHFVKLAIAFATELAMAN